MKAHISPARTTWTEKVIMKNAVKGTPPFVLFMTGPKLHNLHKCPTWQFPT